MRNGRPSTVTRSAIRSQPHARTDVAGPTIVVTSVSGYTATSTSTPTSKNPSGDGCQVSIRPWLTSA